MLEPKLRHSEFFFHRYQHRRIFTNNQCSPVQGQRFALIQQHLIHFADRADMLKRDILLPGLVAGVAGLFGGVTDTVVGPPVLPIEASAFQVKRDSPEHFVDREARPDARLCAIDQRIDQYAGFFRIERVFE